MGRCWSCFDGSWTNGRLSFAYQWRRDGTRLGPATRTRSRPAIRELTLTCAVATSNAVGAASPATSNGTAVVGPRCPRATGSLNPN